MYRTQIDMDVWVEMHEQVLILKLRELMGERVLDEAEDLCYNYMAKIRSAFTLTPACSKEVLIGYSKALRVWTREKARQM